MIIFMLRKQTFQKLQNQRRNTEKRQFFYSFCQLIYQQLLLTRQQKASIIQKIVAESTKIDKGG
jgi:hypothetical protein